MKKVISLFLTLVMVVGIVSGMPVNVSATNSMVENAINWAIGIANDNNYGYSQVNRYGNPDYDCSSLVSTAFHNAGFNVACELNTYTMKDAFVNAGFTWIPASQISGFPSSCANLQRGDILLATSHTELYIGNGKNVGAHMDYNGIPGGIGGGKTWSNGYNAYRYGADEIDVCNYWNDNWLGVLRYNSVKDGLANIGDDFFAVILNTAYWKPITANSNETVTLEKEVGQSNQLWYFDRQDDGSYVITSASNGKALEMFCGYTTPGNPVYCKEYWGGNYQKWSIYKQGDGYVFVSKHYPEYDLAITLCDNSSANGTKITTSTRSNESSQIFSIYSGGEVQLKPPTLNVSVGNSATSTKFTWGEVYGENWYDLKIWKDQLQVGEAYHIEWGAKSGYTIQLPAGTYYAYVDALNYYQCKMSNVVTFTVSEKTYKITYNANGGSGAPSSQTKTYGQTLTLSSTKPTRSGYTFLGWSISSTATKATYSAGGSFTTDANTILYAVWQKNHFHSYTGTVTKAPTCTQSGVKTFKCSCGASYTQTISATGHTVVKDPAIAATCTKAGKTEGSHCSVCNSVIKAQTVISATGHTESGWITNFPATQDTAGERYKECTKCKKILDTKTIKQLKCSKPGLSKIENTTNGVKISWKDVFGADSYTVFRKTDSSGKYTKIGTTSKTAYTDKSAKSGKKYYYYVKAVNEAGSSSASKSKSILYLADATLKTPSSTKSGIVLKWSKVTGADGYYVYRKTGSGSYSKIATVKGNSKVTYIDKKAKKGKTYTYKIKAYKSKTTGAYSNAKKIKDKY